jgi:hypothetical protein
MESRSIAGYTRRIIEIITARGEAPATVRFYYWIDRPQSMITGTDASTFAARLHSFFNGKPVPMRVELAFSNGTVEITEYEAALFGKHMDE